MHKQIFLTTLLGLGTAVTAAPGKSQKKAFKISASASASYIYSAPPSGSQSAISGCEQNLSDVYNVISICTNNTSIYPTYKPLGGPWLGTDSSGDYWSSLLPGPSDGNTTVAEYCTQLGLCLFNNNGSTIFPKLYSCASNNETSWVVPTNLLDNIDLITNGICSQNATLQSCYQTTITAITSATYVLLDNNTVPGTTNWLQNPTNFPNATDLCTPCVNNTLTTILTRVVPNNLGTSTTTSMLLEPIQIAYAHTCPQTAERTIVDPDTGKNTTTTVNITIGGADVPTGPSATCQNSWLRYMNAADTCFGLFLNLSSFYNLTNGGFYPQPPILYAASGPKSGDASATPEPMMVTAPATAEAAPTMTDSFIAAPATPTTKIAGPGGSSYYWYSGHPFYDYVGSFASTWNDSQVSDVCSAVGKCDASTNWTTLYNQLINDCSSETDLLATAIVAAAQATYLGVQGVFCAHDDASDAKPASYCFNDFVASVSGLRAVITKSNISNDGGDFCSACQQDALSNAISFVNVTFSGFFNNYGNADGMVADGAAAQAFSCGDSSYTDGLNDYQTCTAASTALELTLDYCYLSTNIGFDQAVGTALNDSDISSPCSAWKSCFNIDHSGWANIGTLKDNNCLNSSNLTPYNVRYLQATSDLLWGSYCQPVNGTFCFSNFVNDFTSIITSLGSQQKPSDAITSKWCNDPCYAEMKSNLRDLIYVTGYQYVIPYFNWDTESAFYEWSASTCPAKSSATTTVTVTASPQTVTVTANVTSASPSTSATTSSSVNVNPTTVTTTVSPSTITLLLNVTTTATHNVTATTSVNVTTTNIVRTNVTATTTLDVTATATATLNATVTATSVVLSSVTLTETLTKNVTVTATDSVSVPRTTTTTSASTSPSSSSAAISGSISTLTGSIDVSVSTSI